MRTHSPLVLDVKDVLEHPGVQHPITFDAPVPEMRVGLSEVTDDVRFDLVLEAIEGGVVVRGTMSGRFTGECRRCLEPVRQPFSHKASEIYRPVADAWEEGYVIKDTLLDLEPMARDTIALNLPTSPICRQDCAGLCAQCGADLNQGRCDCSQERTDARWSALKDLGRTLGNG